MAARETDLAPLFSAVADLVPGAAGAIGPAGSDWIRPAHDNRAAVAALLAEVRQAEPGAGAMFHATRTWALLSWRPAVLAVLGVHRAGRVPGIDRVALGPGAVYRLPGAQAEFGTPSHLIGTAGARLRRRADALLGDLARLVAVKPGLARRLLADRVLGLLALEAARGTCTAAECPALGQRWLAAMDLPGASALALETLPDGRRQPVLERRSCCLEFRAAAGAVCASCPRLGPAERRARQHGRWSADAGAL